MARLTRAESKVRTRERLIWAGRRIFSRTGFHAASVEEIAEAAGFSRGAFYANFADKADLLLCIVEQRDDAVWAEVETVLEQTSPEDMLPAMQAWFDRVALDPGLALAWAEMWPQAMRDRALRRRLVQRQERTRGVVSDMLRRYCETAGLELPLPPEHFAAMALALGDGLAAQRHLEPSALPGDIFVQGLAYLWLGSAAGAEAGVTTTAMPERETVSRETRRG